MSWVGRRTALHTTSNGKVLLAFEDGLNAVAVPVRQADGGIVASLSVSGTTFRMRSIDLPRIARLAVDAGAAVSRRLGNVERRRTG